MKQKELSICGLAAVEARFARDAGSILRLYFDYATGRKIGAMCKALAAAKKIYRCVEPAELEKIAGSVHHGGIVAVVAAPVLDSPGESEVHAWAARCEPLLLLDRIGNAHNLGAIARTAAFFGVRMLVLVEHPLAALPGDAAYRVAEGGLEHMDIFCVRDLPWFCRDLVTAGYDVIGAATKGGKLEMKDRRKNPVALVVGNEESGLAPDVAAACTRLVTIPGSGRVESLNVSTAAAVLMWELFARK
ncbi:MAG TPA: RNA methyltransferase [Opitutaceae bacterium]|jgi:TrmH RNA methyltransferase|nr:RNA methyltransferase [Opitutaceae bacterium]